MVVFLPGNCVSVPGLCDAPIQNYYMCGTTWSVWLRDQEFMSLCNCILCVSDDELCICDVCPCCPHPSGGPWCSTLDPAPMWSRNQAAARPPGQGLIRVSCKPATSCGPTQWSSPIQVRGSTPPPQPSSHCRCSVVSLNLHTALLPTVPPPEGVAPW